MSIRCAEENGPRMSGDGFNGREISSLLDEFRPKLRRMVSLRLDPRLRRRVDSSDVIQESFVDVVRRLPEYQRAPDMPFFVWVRLLVAQKLLETHRRHLEAERRDVRRELAGPEYPEPTSASLARAFVAPGGSPSEALVRKEQEERLRSALERMEETDREILLLKHFEQLSDKECAAAVGLSLSGAVSRHVRALKRLREVLRAYPDLWERFRPENPGGADDG